MSFEDIHTWIYHLCVVMWVSDFLKFQSPHLWGFPGDADGKESACNVGDLGSVPGSGRSPGEGDPTHSRILAWRMPQPEEPGG